MTVKVRIEARNPLRISSLLNNGPKWGKAFARLIAALTYLGKLSPSQRAGRTLTNGQLDNWCYPEV
jgi:hypothetical protein